MFIDVVRTEYPEKVIHYKNGSEKVIPERYECKYQYKGRTIAYYDSRDDVVYLNDDFVNIGVDRSDRNKWKEWCFKSEYDRAMECPNHEAYEYMFAMLGIDKDTSLSGYMSAF